MNKKTVIFLGAVIIGILLLSTVNGASIQKLKTSENEQIVKGQSQAENIYVDPDLYLTREEHLEMLIEEKDTYEDYHIGEIISDLIDALGKKEFLTDEDVFQIVSKYTFGKSKMALHFGKTIDSSGPGSCWPWNHISISPSDSVPASWNGRKNILNQAKTTIGKRDEVEYKGDHSGHTLCFHGITNDNSGTYKVNGAAAIIFIFYEEGWGENNVLQKNIIFNQIFERLGLLKEIFGKINS